MAPSTIAAPSGNSGISFSATIATAQVLKQTKTIAMLTIGRRLARKSRHDV